MAPLTLSTAFPTAKRGKVRLSQGSRSADLVIEAKGERFPVHFNLLCCQSPVLREWVNKYSSTKAWTGVYPLSGFEPRIVDFLLDLMYEETYLASYPHWDRRQDEQEDAWRERVREEMKFHIQVASLVDYFDLPRFSMGFQIIFANGMSAYDDDGRLSDLIHVLLELNLYEKYSSWTWKNLDRDILSRYIRHDGYAILDIHKSLRNDILDTLHERIKAVDDEAQNKLDKWWEHQMVFTTKRRGCIQCMRNQEVVEEYDYTGKFVTELCGTCRTDELCSLYDYSSDVNFSSDLE